AIHRRLSRRVRSYEARLARCVAGTGASASSTKAECGSRSSRAHSGIRKVRKPPDAVSCWPCRESLLRGDTVEKSVFESYGRCNLGALRAELMRGYCPSNRYSAGLLEPVWRAFGGSGRWRRGGIHREPHWDRVVVAGRASRCA